MGFFYTPRNKHGGEEFYPGRISAAVLVLLIAVIGSGMWGCPQYTVWQQEMSGRAQLAKAEQNRQIAVQEAQARAESAVSDAEAEVARAKGVAEANEIIQNGLGGPEGYLKWLWIQQLGNDSNSVLYVPTEGQIPIMEAGRTPAHPSK